MEVRDLHRLSGVEYLERFCSELLSKIEDLELIACHEQLKQGIKPNKSELDSDDNFEDVR